ncbi:MAG: tetratricopeptide repeat protein [Candidatus Eremiobacteraeota bacterium]|nr:tetratricopeptide repeat protein [Candidatus Eremiobacteraeota bacterium]
MLVQARGETVNKETFFSQVWPAEETCEGNLAQHIFMLRNILQKYDSRHPYILTVSGHGYRLGADVRDGHAFTMFSDADSELLRLCLIGNHLLEKRSSATIGLAQQHFEDALRINEEYAPALIGLARARALVAEYMYALPAAGFEDAKEILTRTLALHPNSGNAHALLSEIALFADWDVAAAENALSAALELDSESPLARANVVWFNLCKGDIDEALRQCHRAMQRSPSSLALLYLLGRVLVHRGDYKAAQKCFADVLETDTDFVLAKEWLGLALLFDGDPAACISEVRNLNTNEDRDLSYLMARASAEAGHAGDARAVLSSMRLRQSDEYIPSWYLACVETALGMTSEATEHLKSAAQSREVPVLFVRSLPMFDAPTVASANLQPL